MIQGRAEGGKLPVASEEGADPLVRNPGPGRRRSSGVVLISYSLIAGREPGGDPQISVTILLMTGSLW